MVVINQMCSGAVPMGALGMDQPFCNGQQNRHLTIPRWERENTYP
jgi:hypothetical protein